MTIPYWWTMKRCWFSIAAIVPFPYCRKSTSPPSDKHWTCNLVPRVALRQRPAMCCSQVGEAMNASRIVIEKCQLAITDTTLWFIKIVVTYTSSIGLQITSCNIFLLKIISIHLISDLDAGFIPQERSWSVGTIIRLIIWWFLACYWLVFVAWVPAKVLR